MRVTKITAVVVLLFYGFLWFLALHGASSLVGPLAVPPILAVIIALGVALNRYMGITPRKQKFNDPNDETEQ